jgi:hypothetical protein
MAAWSSGIVSACGVMDREIEPRRGKYVGCLSNKLILKFKAMQCPLSPLFKRGSSKTTLYSAKPLKLRRNENCPLPSILTGCEPSSPVPECGCDDLFARRATILLFCF